MPETFIVKTEERSKRSSPECVAASAKHLVGCSDRFDSAGVDHDDRRCKPDHLFDRMRDIHNRYFELVAHLLDQRHDLKLALHVERRKRLVEEKKFRAGKKRPPDRHPLPFAAR